ncbi:MAG: glycoside hydrolase family 78 protein [Eubacterium sp.]|nr:glycoside hydrolase family 78 protein [Eubacterium sp.]
MKLYDLCIEYREEPRGLSVRIPRFSWKLEAEERNTMQKAYRICVFSGEETVWDSGRIEDAQSVLVPYAGKELEEETEYQVKILVEDNHGNTAESRTAFSTGVFDGTHFKARMITHDFEKEETACPVFYKSFSAAKPVAKACLYATAHGVYEVQINGKRVGEDYMCPGWTEYHKRLQYQYYEITEYLKEENHVEMTVGNGWYKGILSFDCKPDRYGDRVAAFAEIHITYQDGSKEIIATDTDWKVRTGQIRYSEIYMGETIDTAGAECREGKVSEAEFDASVLVPQGNEPVRITQRLAAKRIFTDSKRNRLVDFGQNLTGLVEIRVKGYPGQKITIRHAETLDREGVFYPDTLRTAISLDTYILNGEEQVLIPHFTFHGFRYIAVEGLENMSEDMFTACVMHSDMKKIGAFHCTNETVNRLQSNIEWGLRDNFFDIPSDCPQRDERLGWMGDAQVFSWTAAFNRNTALFFSKWMKDVAAASSLEEGVPHIVPDIQGTYSSAAWSDAAVIIPWVVYQAYGDVRILEESWQCMHEWVDYIRNRVNENKLWMTNYQYGDWLALDREQGEGSVGATDVYLVANACYLHVTDLVAKTARVLGKNEEASYYEGIYAQTLESFREEYYTSRGRIVSETQTGCVLSLHFDLAREKDRKTIVKTLVSNIEDHKNHLTTGFVGTPYLCHALSDNGAHDVAGLLFMRDDYPSWLYSVKMGATTMWERWDAIRPDGSMPHPGLNSMNHYAYGSIGDWIYRKIGGINQIEAGYRKFYIKPMFVRGIEEAETKLDTPYGEIVSAWSCRKKKIRVEVRVPANTTALIYLPEKEGVLEVGSGDYLYEYDTDTSLKELRFSLDSTLGEIMEQPLGRQLLDQMVPELMANPMIEYAKRMTLAEGISSAPEIRTVYEIVLKALNEQDE